MHKEELTQSKAEGDVKRRIEQKAAVNQKRRTDELEKAKTVSNLQLPPFIIPLPFHHLLDVS